MTIVLLTLDSTAWIKPHTGTTRNNNHKHPCSVMTARGAALVPLGQPLQPFLFSSSGPESTGGWLRASQDFVEEAPETWGDCYTEAGANKPRDRGVWRGDGRGERLRRLRSGRTRCGNGSQGE